MVGAEYIITEKIPGVTLESVWEKMKIKDRCEIIKTIGRCQKAWASVSFERYGSLYYAGDLDAQPSQGPLYVDQHGAQISDPKFAIGPSTSTDFTSHGRV